MYKLKNENKPASWKRTSALEEAGMKYAIEVFCPELGHSYVLATPYEDKYCGFDIIIDGKKTDVKNTTVLYMANFINGVFSVRHPFSYKTQAQRLLVLERNDKDVITGWRAWGDLNGYLKWYFTKKGLNWTKKILNDCHGKTVREINRSNIIPHHCQNENDVFQYIKNQLKSNTNKFLQMFVEYEKKIYVGYDWKKQPGENECGFYLGYYKDTNPYAKHKIAFDFI